MGLMTITLVLHSNIVCPSGRARATISAATMPPPPGRLSITMFCPSVSVSLTASVRADTSAGPPGANGMTNLIGCDGKFCGQTGGAASAQAPSEKSQR